MQEKMWNKEQQQERKERLWKKRKEIDFPFCFSSCLHFLKREIICANYSSLIALNEIEDFIT